MKPRKLFKPGPTVDPLESGGFSLVEVTIAIGIFAFVVVGIMGLFPSALRQRTDAALETRAVLVAQQIFESIQSSPSTNRIFLPPLFLMGEEDSDLRNRPVGSFPVTLQFSRSSTSALRVTDGQNIWTSGVSGDELGGDDADALARVRIVPEAAAPGLYLATVDFGRPATLPADKRRTISFSKLVFIP